MNIAIFGANGATGRMLTSHSLTQGHKVTVLTRQPRFAVVASQNWNPGDAYPQESPTLKVVHGSVFELDPVLRTLEGINAVFSALGAHSPFRNENVLPRAIPVIVQAMQQTGVRRIIALGSAGALPDSLARQPAWRRWIAHKVIYPYILKWPVYEQVMQYRVLSASDLDWTMVMPPVLTHGPARNSYRIDGEALPRNGKSISRADVAQFMFQQLNNSQWVRRGVYISN
ncbi:MAG TPA: NAD(P)H-binding protein [Edaphobacter sp.]|nr:NAD(P)H-binding protein [Edaphobacter sp.]